MVSRFPLMVKFFTQHPKTPIVNPWAKSKDSKCMALTNGQLVPSDQVRNFADKVFGKDDNPDVSQPIPGMAGSEPKGDPFSDEKPKKEDEGEIKKKSETEPSPPKKE